MVGEHMDCFGLHQIRERGGKVLPGQGALQGPTSPQPEACQNPIIIFVFSGTFRTNPYPADLQFPCASNR